MGLAVWLRSPRRTLTVFLTLMLVLGGALGWFGWQLLRQDRALEGQRRQERLEQAVDRMAALLQQSLADLESYLSFGPVSGAEDLPDGVSLLRVNKHVLEAYPAGRLLYSPAIPDEKEPPASTFSAGENLEYQRDDPAAAVEVFRELAQSPDPGVRAGALLRLGRNFRKIGRTEDALQAYNELARLGRTSVFGLPAELMAHEASGTLLEAVGRREDLRREAALMHAALWSGRWSLLHPAWEFHAGEAQRWLGPMASTECEQDALTLSVGAESIYSQWVAGPESKGRRILKNEGRPVLISWAGTSDQLAAVLAGPGYLRLKWTGALRGPSVQGALIDEAGQVQIGSFNKSGLQAIRTTPFTRLPGTLYATYTQAGAEASGFMGRRRLLFSGFSVLALALLAGSYFIMRSINRERAVARLQSEFVSTVSHEFRTPLTSLRQLSEMLSKGRVPTEDLRQKSYEILSRESERLQRLVESLLDFGRIEAGAFRYHFQNLDPAKWIADLIAEFKDHAVARGCHVELKIPGTYPLILADPEALGLAVRNLLDNAVKYSPDCRTVWVEMALERDRLAIRVRDKGIGIPAAEQKEIFERFVRGTGSRAVQIQGTGIGLALARHIVEAHAGEIRLESKSGQGSTFTILLPLEKKA